jgi:hypothetical protein
MKKNYHVILMMLAMAAFSGMKASGQTPRIVVVEPGLGTLNAAIDGDTTDLGERIDENTVYQLRRGDEAYYGLLGYISNSGFPLTIEAEEGDGARPFLQPRVVEGEGSRAFRPRGDITLRGLHVTNLDDLGGLSDQLVRCSADDIKVVIDDCWFDKAGQSFIRTDNPGQSYFITNSVISNIGNPSSLDNGRGIDDRGNDIDTIVFENTTWYNLTSRVIRDGGGTIKYVRITNNTIVNIGQMGITFGPVGKVEMANNIGVNMGFVPKDDDSGWEVFSADSVEGVAPVIIMENNSAWLDTAAIAMYLNDTTTITPFMNPTMTYAVLASGTAMTNYNFDIEFTDGPPFADSLVMYNLDPAFDLVNAPFWEEPEVDPGSPWFALGAHQDVPYDFGYAHSGAYSGAKDGGQLGDPKWTASPSVGIRERNVDQLQLSLYPQPVSGQVSMSFTLSEESTVSVEVYNLAGARVAELTHKLYFAGSHTLTWDTGNFQPGIYLVRMNTGAVSSTVKMIVE